jgi:Bax protein
LQRIYLNLLKALTGCTLIFTLIGCSEDSKDNASNKKPSTLTKDSSKNSQPKISVAEKKKRFKELLIPAVDNVYTKLDKQYNEVKSLVEAGKKDPKIDSLMKKYSAKSIEQLLIRLKPHPKSIALAQAAMESAWATSRFTKVANNIYGVWSFSKNEPRVAASETRGDKTIYVKKYDSITDSIRDYYMVISKGRAYKEFRELNMVTDDPYELVKELDSYSEKGAEYGEELASLIRFNKFYKFDDNNTTN